MGKVKRHDEVTRRMIDKLEGSPKPKQLHITIEGKLGQIPFNTLATMARNSCDILEELDNAVSAKPGGTLEWFVSGISTEASLTVTIEPKPKLKDVDYSDKVAELFVDGLAHIEKEHTTPPYFSDYGLRKAHSIAKTLRKNGAKAIKVEDIARDASGFIKAEVADSLKKLISIQYREIGSVEGTLEIISVHRSPRITIYHSITRRSVNCKFEPKLLESAKEGLGNRVTAHGMVYFNYMHEPVRVDTDRIVVMPPEKGLPTARDLRGLVPDFTGDLKTEDYIRGLRE